MSLESDSAFHARQLFAQGIYSHLRHLNKPTFPPNCAFRGLVLSQDHTARVLLR